MLNYVINCQRGKHTRITSFNEYLKRKCLSSISWLYDLSRSCASHLTRQFGITLNLTLFSGCSPGKRFILKLLSPVVCGLSNDKYMNLHSSESYSSLTSCSSDVSAEADLLSQKLTDFNVQDVAEELALIDKELLIRITWQEMATCGWMSINKVFPCI